MRSCDAPATPVRERWAKTRGGQSARQRSSSLGSRPTTSSSGPGSSSGSSEAPVAAAPEAVASASFALTALAGPVHAAPSFSVAAVAKATTDAETPDASHHNSDEDLIWGDFRRRSRSWGKKENQPNQWQTGLEDLYELASPLLDPNVTLSYPEQRYILHNVAHRLKSPAWDWNGPGTPLKSAIDAGQAELVHVMVQAGINPNEPDSHGVSPLHGAVFSGRVDVCHILLEGQAKVDARDRHGQTPLFFAPTIQLCRLLCDSRADISAVNFNGQSALHFAARAGLRDVLHWFLERCSKSVAELRDVYGATASDYLMLSCPDAVRQGSASHSPSHFRAGRRRTPERRFQSQSLTPRMSTAIGSPSRCMSPCLLDACGARSLSRGRGSPPPMPAVVEEDADDTGSWSEGAESHERDDACPSPATKESWGCAGEAPDCYSASPRSKTPRRRRVPGAKAAQRRTSSHERHAVCNRRGGGVPAARKTATKTPLLEASPAKVARGRTRQQGHARTTSCGANASATTTATTTSSSGQKRQVVSSAPKLAVASTAPPPVLHPSTVLVPGRPATDAANKAPVRGMCLDELARAAGGSMTVVPKGPEGRALRGGGGGRAAAESAAASSATLIPKAHCFATASAADKPERFNMSPGNASFDWAPEVVGKHGISVEYDALGQFSSGSVAAVPHLVENFPNRRNLDDASCIGLDVDEKESASRRDGCGENDCAHPHNDGDSAASRCASEQWEDPHRLAAKSLQETPQLVEDSELPEECW